MSFPANSYFTSVGVLDPQQGYGGILSNYTSLTQSSGTINADSLLEISPLLPDGTVNPDGGIQLNGKLISTSTLESLQGLKFFDGQQPIMFQIGTSTNTVAIPVINSGSYTDYYVGSANSASIPYSYNFPNACNGVYCVVSGFNGDPGIYFQYRSLNNAPVAPSLVGSFDGYIVNNSANNTALQAVGTVSFTWIAWGY